MKRAPKAYKNMNFMSSSEARVLRIMSEYIEPKHRLEENNVKHTVVFFGSARVKSGMKTGNFDAGKCYDAAEEFAFRLGSWSKELQKEENDHGFAICTGGGPGIMEAANHGAIRAKCKSIGLNISLPHEQFPNDFITPHLNFEFHYFFMRKLWFIYHAKALVVFPGGFGTMDELFEALTLFQNKKLQKPDFPILMYDPVFWKDMINFPKLVECGLISADDAKLVHFFSTPDEGMEYLKPKLEQIIRNFKH
jgi:uncharacterized protein (TIGR00730 family)